MERVGTMIGRIPYWLSPGWWIAYWIGQACSYAGVNPIFYSWTSNWLFRNLINVALGALAAAQAISGDA